MSAETPEYVMAAWGDDAAQAIEVVTVELPSRECVVQLETPVHILEKMETLGQRYDAELETVLAERLEINRARVELVAAAELNSVEDIQTRIDQANEYLSGVEVLSEQAERVKEEVNCPAHGGAGLVSELGLCRR